MFQKVFSTENTFMQNNIKVTLLQKTRNPQKNILK